MACGDNFCGIFERFLAVFWIILVAFVGDFWRRLCVIFGYVCGRYFVVFNFDF